jgi:hypothetical protein
MKNDHYTQNPFLFIFNKFIKSFKNQFKKDISIVKNKGTLSIFFKKVTNLLSLMGHVGFAGRYLYINLPDHKGVSIKVDTLFCTQVELVNYREKVDFSVPSRQLEFAMKFPWGVDTLNVTATSQIYSAKAEVFLWLIYQNNKRI